MSNFVTTGSNVVMVGNKVDITIKISQGDALFKLGGKLKVYDVFNIIDKEATLDKKAPPPVQFRKSSDQASGFTYNEDNSFTYKINSNKELKLKSFDIIIKGQINPNFKSLAELKIEIPTGIDNFEHIVFKVEKTDNTIAIEEFKASYKIIQKNGKKLALSYQIKGEGANLTLLENAKPLAFDLSKQSIPITFDGKPSGLYEYTLEAKKGNQTVSKSINIIYVEETTIKPRAVPEGKRILNFCIAQEENYLYALLRSQEGIFEIGFTEQIDGENTWSIIKIKNQETIKLFETSPMVHLQSDNEKKEGKQGQLYFICGSRIGKLGEPDKVANQVAIINLDEEGDNIKIHYPTKKLSKDDTNPKKLPAKFGHTCILFPTEDNPNTIWMLGGQDKYGEPSNEILTSPDGLTWTVQDNTPPWSARCMLSAAVSWKYDGNERKKDMLWIAGGFHDFAGSGGGFKNDVWRKGIDKNEWEEITFEQALIKKDSSACGIAYSGIEETGDTGIFVFGSANKSGENYFLKLNKNYSKYVLLNNTKQGLSFTHFNQGVYITGFFRECMWVMGVYDTGLEGVTYYDLYYRIPTIHQETIK